MTLMKYQIDSITNIVKDKLSRKIDYINKQLTILNKKEITLFKKDILKNDEIIKDVKKYMKLIDKYNFLYKEIYTLRDKIYNESKRKLYMNSYNNDNNKGIIKKYIQDKTRNNFLVPKDSNLTDINIKDFIIVEDALNKRKLTIDNLVDKLIIKILKENDNNR